MRPFLFYSQQRVYLRRYSGAPLEARLALPGRGDVRHDMAWHCRRLAAETRGDRAPMVPFPLLTPQTLLWTRLPPVARLKARGPQGRLVLQGITLDRSGAGRSTNQAPCTVWPRTNMRGKSRKVNSGHNSVPKSARRPESCPRIPPVSLHISDVSAQRKVWGVKRGQETIGVLSPFVSAARRRHSRPPKAATPPRPPRA